MSERSSFPADFLWGVASAGHQNEGDNRDSDTWFAELLEPTVFREPSGDACKGYELWREDVDLAAGMGLNAYRFSVEWARVEPSEGTFDDEALAHYEAIADRCLERGMAPVVTFNHFTSPHWFAMRGGWLDPKPGAVRGLLRPGGAAVRRPIAFGVTFNEPNLARLLTWIELPGIVRDLERATLAAASSATGVPAYRLANVMLPEEMDNFEWVFGYGHQLGLHEGDRTTFERTPKPSAGVYAALVRSHRPGSWPASAVPVARFRCGTLACCA